MATLCYVNIDIYYLYLVGGLFLVVSPGDLATNSLLSLSRYPVGGLEHEFYFSIYWECHHPN